MIQLLLSGFFLSLTFITNAAIMQPTELTDSPIQFLDKNKNHPLTYTPQHIDTQQKAEPKHYSKDILINTPTIKSSQQENTNLPTREELENFAKNLITEYGDHELAQQSFSTLYEAKQLWDDVDSQANAFASDIIFSLKLNDFIENDLKKMQQPLHAPSISGLSKKDLDASNQSHNRNNISFYQVRQAQDNSSTQDLHQLNSHFIDKLFRKTTLYYLIAFFILFSILQWIIKLYLRFNP